MSLGRARQLLDMLAFYSRFEISDQTGDPLSDRDMMQLHYGRITSLQVGVYSRDGRARRDGRRNGRVVGRRETEWESGGEMGGGYSRNSPF